MAYDEDLAERVRACLTGRKGFSERKMFGGIAFLLDGRMCCGVLKSDLMVRVPQVHCLCFQVAGEEGQKTDFRTLTPRFPKRVLEEKTGGTTLREKRSIRSGLVPSVTA